MSPPLGSTWPIRFTWSGASATPPPALATIDPSGITTLPSGRTLSGPAGTGTATPVPVWNRLTTDWSWPMIVEMIVHVPPLPVPVGHRTSMSATNGLNHRSASGARFGRVVVVPSARSTVLNPEVADRNP